MMHKAKQQQGSDTSAMAVSYLLTNETISELPQAVKMCCSLGLSLFAGVHLTHPATSRQEAMRLYNYPKMEGF